MRWTQFQYWKWSKRRPWFSFENLVEGLRLINVWLFFNIIETVWIKGHPV